MKSARGGIPLWIGALPAIGVAGGVERLCAIAHEVAHDAHDVDDIGLSVGNFFRRSVFFESFQVGKTRTQFSIIFRDRPWQETNELTCMVLVFVGIDHGEAVGMRLPRQSQLSVKNVAEFSERFWGLTNVRQILQVDVVLRPIQMFQRELGTIPPTIRFAAEKSDALARFGCGHELRKFRRQCIQSQQVHGSMADVVPGVKSRGSSEEQTSGEKRQRAAHAGNFAQLDREVQSPARVKSVNPAGAFRRGQQYKRLVVIARKLLIFAWFCGLTLARSETPDQTLPAERVIVLANSKDPDSRRLAAYYVEKRGIPVENVIALPMPGEETITWRQFIDSVFQPLQDELVRRHWIDAIRTELKDNLGRIKYAFSGHRISYLVVCRGVPLRVDHDPTLYTPVPPLTDSSQFQTNGGAVDSELSLLAYPNYPINALVQNPLFGNDHPNIFHQARIIKVSRLDGPTLPQAMGLVDSAMEAERTGLIGRAYADIGGIYKQGDVWFESVARQLEESNFDLSVDREPSTMPATARFDRPVLYFGWYANDLSGPFAQPEFHFPPGAIALHLHSFSARSLRSSHYGWTGPLIARGVTATVGNVFEPYLNLTHHPHLLARALLRGDCWGDAVYFSLPSVSWQTIAIGDPLYRPFARSFAQQWEHRATLSDEQYAYVVLRELRRMEREVLVSKAMELAEEVMQTKPSIPIALKWAQLGEKVSKPDVARRAAEWIAAVREVRPAELPLAEEAAQILLRVGQAAAAVDFYAKLLNLPKLSPEFRTDLLKKGAAAATAAHRDDLASRWSAEAAGG